MADATHHLDPNGLLNTVPGNGTRFTLHYDSRDGTVTNTTFVTLEDGLWLITSIVPWPYGSGIRGQVIQIGGVDYAGEEHSPAVPYSGGALSVLYAGSGNLAVQVYQNSGANSSFVGALVKAQKLA